MTSYFPFSDGWHMIQRRVSHSWIVGWFRKMLHVPFFNSRMCFIFAYSRCSANIVSGVIGWSWLWLMQCRKELLFSIRITPTYCIMAYFPTDNTLVFLTSKSNFSKFLQVWMWCTLNSSYFTFHEDMDTALQWAKQTSSKGWRQCIAFEVFTGTCDTVKTVFGQQM